MALRPREIASMRIDVLTSTAEGHDNNNIIILLLPLIGTLHELMTNDI